MLQLVTLSYHHATKITALEATYCALHAKIGIDFFAVADLRGQARNDCFFCILRYVKMHEQPAQLHQKASH